MNTPEVEAEIVQQPQMAVAVRHHESAPVTLTDRDIDVLVAVGAIPKGTPPDVVVFFSKSCGETRLSPFKRQVHLIKRWSRDGDRYTVQTGIDGYRAIANRTGLYAGNDEYKFDEGLTQYEMLKANRKRPLTATATVYKAIGGIRCPFSASCQWDEYYPGEKQGFMWDKMPFLMLGKCAESLALRKAFPEELAGLYTDEEMAQADVKTDKVAPPPAKAAPRAPTTPKTATPEPFKTAEAFLEHAKTELIGKIKAANLLFPAWVWAVQTGNLMTNERFDNISFVKLFPSADATGTVAAARLAVQTDTKQLRTLIDDLDASLPQQERDDWQRGFEVVYGPKGTSIEEPPKPPQPTKPPAAKDGSGGVPTQCPKCHSTATKTSTEYDLVSWCQKCGWQWGDGGKAWEAHPWASIICPIPPKGSTKKDYDQAPLTLGQIMRTDHKRFYGLVMNNQEAKGWTDREGKERPPSEADKRFALACKQAVAHFDEKKSGAVQAMRDGVDDEPLSF